jgi:phosphatidylglycerophosphate synthase
MTDMWAYRPRTVAAALAIELALLAALWAMVRLGSVGWLAGTTCALVTCLLLTRGLRRTRVRLMGPADRVTLARALVVCGVTALVADRSPHPVLVATMAGVALLLDGVDGQVARRTGTASAFGARFDMEVDAFLILVLSVHDSMSLGPWVLAIGLMRYGFVATSVPYPWLKVPLPPSQARKIVAAVQGVALTAAVVLPHPEAPAATAAALVALTWSFARDIRWLARKAHAGRGADTQPAIAAPIGLDDPDDGPHDPALLGLWSDTEDTTAALAGQRPA